MTVGVARIDLGSALERIVVESDIDAFIRAKLDCVRTDDDLVAFFRRFALYNLAFPGGVAMLAGAFHMRPDLFKDAAEPLIDNRDRSSEIASHIIFAAEDEFATRNRTIRVTHRMMAQEVVKSAIAYAGWDLDRFNSTFAADEDYADKALALRKGYRVYSLQNERDMFLGLGFHLGSERLADIEFNALNEMLAAKFPRFVEYARDIKGNHGLPVYGWVSTHTTVEVDHFDYSLLAANKAIDLYVGSELDAEQISHLIRVGFEEFVQHQRDMFDWLS